MFINPQKSQILHIRNYQKPRSKLAVMCGKHELSYVEHYKYLGFIVHEHLSPQKTVQVLTGAASRSFGRVVNLFKKLKNMGISTHETLYDSYVRSIMNYAAAVWGYAEQNEPHVLQNCVQRYYLGVNKYTPKFATRLEFEWLDPKFQRWIEIARYWNHLVDMKKDRLPVKVLNWDKSLGLNTWYSQLKHILHYSNMDECLHTCSKCDLEVLKARLTVLNKYQWWLEANNKPKLRTYVKVHDKHLHQAIVKRNLSRPHRSVISKFKCGVLPIMVETR